MLLHIDQLDALLKQDSTEQKPHLESAFAFKCLLSSVDLSREGDISYILIHKFYQSTQDFITYVISIYMYALYIYFSRARNCSSIVHINLINALYTP